MKKNQQKGSISGMTNERKAPEGTKGHWKAPKGTLKTGDFDRLLFWERLHLVFSPLALILGNARLLFVAPDTPALN